MVEDENKVRVNKAIASSGYCSRRKADEYIKNKKVQVNGIMITDLSFKIKDTDVISVCGEVLKSKKESYVLLNKPKGYITTTKDPESRKTVMDLLPKEYIGLKPAGRLDKDSEGLLILSNDGDFLQQIQHPSRKVKKKYIVNLDNNLDENAIKSLRFNLISGINIGNEFLKVAFVKQMVTKDVKDKKQTIFEVVLDGGKNRQIRRMFQLLGYSVVRLKRTQIGNLKLGNIKLGKFKEISRDEAYANI